MIFVRNYEKICLKISDKVSMFWVERTEAAFFFFEYALVKDKFDQTWQQERNLCVRGRLQAGSLPAVEMTEERSR
jgi:hypothetical protein